MAAKLPIWDQRMFELMDICLSDPSMGMADSMDFFKTLGVTGPSTISQVKSNKQSFRIKHFYNACKVYGVSMDWFMGFSGSMYRSGVSHSPLHLLKAATRLIEDELLSKEKLTKKLTKQGKIP